MRDEKKQMVKDIKSLVEPASGVVLISYKGLRVHEFADLRTKLAEEAEAECHVVPNRLLRRAASETDHNGLAETELGGETAVVATFGDPVKTVQVIRDFARQHHEVAFKAGSIEGRTCSVEDMDAIADLPSKEVLQAQLLSVLQAPAQRLVSVLNNSVGSVVYALNAYLEKKQSSNE